MRDTGRHVPVVLGRQRHGTARPLGGHRPVDRAHPGGHRDRLDARGGRKRLDLCHEGRRHAVVLGDATTSASSASAPRRTPYAPTQVGTDTDWLRVDAGLGSHVCAVRSTGTLWCWGHDDVGQLGPRHHDGRPRTDPGRHGHRLDGGQRRGGPHVRAARDRYRVVLGRQRPRPGRERVDDPSTVPVVVGAATDWQQVSAGDGHTCGRRVPTTVSNPGSLWCWGRGDAGQLGTGNRTDVTVPTSASAFTYWTDVSAGSLWTCGHRAGELLCWDAACRRSRRPHDGRPGDPGGVRRLDDRSRPGTGWRSGHGTAVRCPTTGPAVLGGRRTGPDRPRRPADERARSRSARRGPGRRCPPRRAACAVSTDGALRCWGESTTYRLPFGGVAPVTTAQVVAGSWADVGPARPPGAASSRTPLWCWGAQTYGQVGTGVRRERTCRTADPGGDPGRLGPGGRRHARLRDPARRLPVVLGDGTAGALGDGGTGVVAVPARVGSGTWASVTAGDHVTCHGDRHHQVLN